MFDFLSVIMKNAFHSPATREYPKVKREPFPGQKGHIDINIENCIFCGMCMRKCPTHAILVKRPDKTWTIDRFKCITCAACTETCPKKCLSMNGQYTPPAHGKSVDSFTKPAAPAAVVKPVIPAAQAAAASHSEAKVTSEEKKGA